MLISLCMIVRDESRVLGRCLDSLRGLADEIVVVDTGSSDGTPEIVRARGGTVLHHRFDDDFAAARNAGLAEARARYVLVLDADEWIDGESDVAAVRQALEAGRGEAFTVTLRDRLDGGIERRYPLLRVFRNRPEYRYERPIHEQISPSIARALDRTRVDAAALPLVVGHDGYTSRRQAEAGKAGRNRRLLERRIAREPDDAAAHYFLVRELIPLRAGRAVPGAHLAAALGRCDDADRRRVDLPPALAADLARLHAAALLAAGRPVAAAQRLAGEADACLAFRLLRLEAALAARAEPNEIKARIGAVRERLDLPDNPSVLPAEEPELAGPVARARIAEAQVAVGDFAGARATARAATAMPGAGAAAWAALAAVERVAADPAPAIRAYLEAIRVASDDPWAWAGLGETLLTYGQAADAVEPLMNATRLAPGWQSAEEALATAWILGGNRAALQSHFESKSPSTPTTYAAQALAAALTQVDSAAPTQVDFGPTQVGDPEAPRGAERVDEAAAEAAVAESVRRILRRVAVAGRPDITVDLAARLPGVRGRKSF